MKLSIFYITRGVPIAELFAIHNSNYLKVAVVSVQQNFGHIVSVDSNAPSY